MPILTDTEIARLTAPERLALIGELWDSLDDQAFSLPASQRLELERRLSSFDGDKAQAVSWDQLKAELAPRTA